MIDNRVDAGSEDPAFGASVLRSGRAPAIGAWISISVADPFIDCCYEN
jgi:hypothetical protein